VDVIETPNTKSLMIRTSAGNDMVALDNVDTGGELTVRTFGDNDVVSFIEIDAGYDAVIFTGSGTDTIMLEDNTFEGDLSMNAGLSDEAVSVGADNHFEMPVKFRGEAGDNDEITLLSTNNDHFI